MNDIFANGSGCDFVGQSSPDAKSALPPFVRVFFALSLALNATDKR